MSRTACWLAIAASTLLLIGAACSGGNDKKNEASVTAPPSTQAAAAPITPGSGGATSGPGGGATGTAVAGAPATGDCFGGLSTYRYTGTLRLKAPAGLGIPSLDNAKLSGASVAPDRIQTKIELGTGANDTIEAITIGKDLYSRQGNGAWQKSSTDTGANFNFKPSDFCQFNPAMLEKARLKPTNEKVNGSDALSYKIGKQDLDKLDQAIGGQAGALTGLFDVFEMNVSFTEKERWPLRMRLNAEQRSSEAISLSFEFNFADFNKSDVKIEAPR